MNQTVKDILNKLGEQIFGTYLFHLKRPQNDNTTAEQCKYSGGASKMLEDVLSLLEIGKKQADDGKEVTFKIEQEVKAAEENINLTANVG